MATMSRRALLAGAMALPCLPAWSQNFPSKPVRWIAPFAAGGNYDLTSRLVGEAMGRQLGQTVIVDNRPGAGGIVGTEAAANAPADGYTVVMGSFSVLFVAPYLASKPSMVPLVTPMHHAVWALGPDLRAGMARNWRGHLSQAERAGLRVRRGDGGTLQALIAAEAVQRVARRYQALPAAFTRAQKACAQRVRTPPSISPAAPRSWAPWSSKAARRARASSTRRWAARSPTG